MHNQRLKLPIPIAEQRWPEDVPPYLSISCLTYNHRDFLARTLDGFLMQETTFRVEISIHDDASTDGTAELARSYQERYPQLIRLAVQRKNQYSKRGNLAIVDFITSLKGRYVAACEGDDFWTDRRKLELQVAYLEAHPEAVLTFHDVERVNERGEFVSGSKIKDLIGAGQPRKITTYTELARSLIPTLSIVYRNVRFRVGVRVQWLTILDCYIYAMLLEHGQAHNVGGTMGAHRMHSGGVWTSRNEAQQLAAIMKTRAAIAREIAPHFCLEACQVLATAASNFARFEISRRRIGSLPGCICRYLGALVICWRAPKRKVEDIVAILVAQLGILSLPIKIVWARLKRKPSNIPK